MITLSVKLPEEVVAALDSKAKARRLSRAAYVREALVEKASAQAGEGSAGSLLERTRNLCGVGESGLGDLSSNPRHLEDFAG